MRKIGKRLWALTLALCMVLSLLTMTARADGERLTIQVGSVTAAPGEYVQIPVTVSGSNVGVAGIALEFTLKTGVNFVPGPSESDGIEEPDPFVMPNDSVFSADDDALVFSRDAKTASLLSNNNVTVNGANQALLTLNVIAPETEGLYTISVAAKGNEASNIVDEDYQPVTAAFQSGTLKVTGTHIHSSPLTPVEAVEPTCKDGHIAYYICEKCHKCFSDADGTNPIKREDTVLTGTDEHQWDEGVVTRKPTLTIKGEMTYTCKVCHTTMTQSIPVVQVIHKHDEEDFSASVEYLAKKDAGCVETGIQMDCWHCKACDNYYAYDDQTCATALPKNDVVISAKGHTWNDGVETTPATASTPGEMLYTCTVCGATKTEVIPPLHTHTTEYHPAVASTCTTDGNIEYWYCTGCEKYFTDAACTKETTQKKTILAKGHKWNDGEVLTPATDKVKGQVKVTCSVCHTEETKDYLLGDVDGNNRINNIDLQMINKSLLKIVTLDSVQRLSANVKRDQKINNQDLQTLNKYLLKIINAL